MHRAFADTKDLSRLPYCIGCTQYMLGNLYRPFSYIILQSAPSPASINNLYSAGGQFKTNLDIRLIENRNGRLIAIALRGLNQSGNSPTGSLVF
jgi:hypothetical protein